MKNRSFEAIAASLQACSGLMIGPDKHYLLEARLAPVLKKHGLVDLDALADRLRSRIRTVITPSAIKFSTELESDMVEAMTTNETLFFRDVKPFTHFRTKALPRLLATRPSGSKIRIWSAATSAGQEAYSLAMILREVQPSLSGHDVEILGTDISNEQIKRAQEGIYTQFEIQRGLPMQYIAKYFKNHDHNWKINDQIQKTVQFKIHNLLLNENDLGIFDIVFCRNVLMYFNVETKSRVLKSISRQLKPDGILYLGGTETVLGVTDAFSPHQGEHGVFEHNSADCTKPMALTG